MKFAIIGAGVAGVCSIHQILKNLPNAEVVAFEINDKIGGTWIYTDKTGVDEFGIPLTTSMYKNLRTNLPKQTMQFSDYPIPEYYDSFMINSDYLKLLNEYAKTFDIKKHIKFRHLVTEVKIFDGIWNVSFKNLQSGVIDDKNFDYVFICNGHYSKFFIPEYEGKNVFKGQQIHSHSYRTPEKFSNRTVLIIGSGPSGMDISIEIAKVARKVFLSHHRNKLLESPFPSNYIQKPDVKEFNENSVIFVDGSVEEIDDIIYCTGYEYYCPFLNKNCGVNVEKNYIYPLYRHIVNVTHPTMFFIGLTQLCCIIPMIEMQIRYVISGIKEQFQIPPKESMLQHVNKYYEDIKESDRTHDLGAKEVSYCCELSNESGITPMPLGYCLIRSDSMLRKQNIYAYRNFDYNIVDETHITITDKENPKNVETIQINISCNDEKL